MPFIMLTKESGKARSLDLRDHGLGRQVVLGHEQGHVADGLGGGGHLDDVAAHVVDRAVHGLDLLPAVAEPQGDGLGAEVGVLAARHLVAVDVGGAGLEAAFEGGVGLAGHFPVVGQLLQALLVQARIASAALQGADEGVEGGLGGDAGHGGEGRVHHVHAGLGGLQQGGHLVAAGIVGVQVDGDGRPRS